MAPLRSPVAGEGHRLGGQQFRVGGEGLEGLVRPEPGFAVLTEFDEHADLAGPGGGVGGIEFEHLGVGAQAVLETAAFERRPASPR